MKYFPILCAMLAVLIASLTASAEERYMRYRVLAPAIPTVATLTVHSHVNLDEYPYSWEGIEQPQVYSNYGLYLPSATWSEWIKLPDPPYWGTIYLNLKANDPIKAAKAEFQLSTYPSDKIIRQFTEATETGGTVGFIIPPKGILDDPRGIETLSESYARRRKVAAAVAIPEYRRPKRLSFGSAVFGNRTLKGSDLFEYETVKLIGFNTYGPRGYARYFSDGAAYSDESYIDTLKYTPEDLKHLAYVYIFDEPAWYSGFTPMWERTKGNEGFRAYLKANAVDPGLFGKRSLDEVAHINRNNEVAADAPIELRRLWYWSCRYTYAIDADFYAGITKKLETMYPGAQSTVNYSDHGILLGPGVAVGNPDIFEWGRKRSVSMQWSEDWFGGGMHSWGNGMYQKLGFLCDLMRCAGRATTPAQTLGFHVVSCAYDPFSPFTDANVGARINLLLGRGVKCFSFFNYGPTSSGTCDWWADYAPAMRDTADALRMVGGDHIEPYLQEGQPGLTDVCMLYSIPSMYWQTQNKAQNDNYEKQFLYCMLADAHVPMDVIDTTDLDRWIAQYKIAYLIDMGYPANQAGNLLDWVKKGGVLVLWPQAASRNEYNEPLAVFPSAPGVTQVGNGKIIRLEERLATIWWEKVLALNTGKSERAVILDDEYISKAAAPALELARVHLPVTASSRGIDVRALFSPRGVAVPVVNLQYLFPTEHQQVKSVNGQDSIVKPTQSAFPDGCVRYTKEKPATVTLRDGQGVVQVYSSRLGNLPFTREGDTITVSFPLDTTDILIFSKVKVPVEKYPWSPVAAPVQPPVKKPTARGRNK